MVAYLAVHSVQLVVEGHGEVGGGAGGHVGDKGRLALVDGVVHVDTTLADLHVLEARLHTAKDNRDGDRERNVSHDSGSGCYFAVQNYDYTKGGGARPARTVCCGGNPGDVTW